MTRIQAGGCCRAIGAGLAYPHMLSAAVRVVWGRSFRQRHLTGPLTGNMPPEADFQNRRPGASAVETDGRDDGTNKDTRALLNRGSVDLPGKPARNGPE